MVDVAALHVTVPALPSFVLRGTVPVPPGTYPRADGQMPLRVLNQDGTPAKTQIETVSKYPRDADGADVVEVLARVNVPAGTVPGKSLAYKVSFAPHQKDMELVYDPAAQKLLAAPGALRLVASDCFGHEYSADVFVPGRQPFLDGRSVLERNGAAARTVKSYATMLPIGGAVPPAFPHLFGVHSYLTVWAEENVVTLDLRINNGPSNRNKSDPNDEILGHVYYTALELAVPKGWVLLQQGPDPLSGTARPAGNETFYSIVASHADGQTLHFFPLKGQFHRRLALCPAGSEAKAQAFLDNRMLGFCQPAPGLWSWWNLATARYFPQRYVLPSLAHVPLATKLKEIAPVLATVLTALKTGKRPASGQIASDRLGYAHPWGAPYGGVTGGTEIWMFDGLVTADIASQDGYTLSSLTHRCLQDRQADVIYNGNGKPTCVEDWLQSSPFGQHTGMNFYEELQDGPDPFGYDDVDTSVQDTHVQVNGLAPSYEAALRGYHPIDQQHLIRNTRAAKVLVWLGNDPLAKDDLRMRAEIWRLGFHQYNNSANGNYSGGGLKGLTEFATKHPGRGLGVGRALGWGMDATNCAYCFGDAVYRAKLLPWYQQIADTLAMGQFTCSGFVMSKSSAKVLGGLYLARQQYEHAIMENGWRGALETVLRGVDAAREAALAAVIGKATLAMVSPMSWSVTGKGPWGQLAVAPLALAGPPYCGLPNPPGGTSTGVEKYQSYSSYAYGYDVTQSQTLLAKAAELVGGTSLKAAMEAAQLNNIENRAALLALAQQP